MSRQSHKIRIQLALGFGITLLIMVGFGVYIFLQAIPLAEKMTDAQQTSVGLGRGELQEAANQANRLVVAALLFVCIGIVVVTAFLLRVLYSISHALSMITESIGNVLSGAGDQEIVLSHKDEFGEIAAFFNEAMQRMRLNESYLKAQNEEMSSLLMKSLHLEQELRAQKENTEQTVQTRTQELHQEHARFLASINSLPFGFMFVNQQLKILALNPRMQKMFGIGDEHASLDVIAEGVRQNAELFQVLFKTSRQCIEHKCVIVKPDIEVDGRFMRALFSPVIMQDEAIGCAMLVEDVTEDRILQRAKDEFFSIASHELRTPLTAIRGNASMIQQYYASDLKDDSAKQMVDDIHSSSIRLIAIVNDFLDVSRLEQKKVELDFKEFSIVDVVKKVANEMETDIKEKGLYLKTDIEEHVPKVYADRGRIEEVLYNLVGNAAKFTKHGGITISVRYQKDVVKVEVADTGCGISRTSQNLLFRKFQQAHESLFTRETERGTGLGLYISKLLMGLMHGTIVLESSEVDKGSVFSFTVPTRRI